MAVYITVFEQARNMNSYINSPLLSSSLLILPKNQRRCEDMNILFVRFSLSLAQYDHYVHYKCSLYCICYPKTNFNFYLRFTTNIIQSLFRWLFGQSIGKMNNYGWIFKYRNCCNLRAFLVVKFGFKVLFIVKRASQTGPPRDPCLVL